MQTIGNDVERPGTFIHARIAISRSRFNYEWNSIRLGKMLFFKTVSELFWSSKRPQTVRNTLKESSSQDADNVHEGSKRFKGRLEIIKRTWSYVHDQLKSFSLLKAKRRVLIFSLFPQFFQFTYAFDVIILTFDFLKKNYN